LIKVVVIGAGGRMGKTIVACVEDTQGVSVSGGTEHAGHPSIGSDLGELAGIGKKEISVVESVEGALAGCDFGCSSALREINSNRHYWIFCRTKKNH